MNASQTRTVLTAQERLIRFHETELRKEPSNVGAKGVKIGTVIARIHAKLRAAHSDLQQMPAGVSLLVSSRFRHYLVDVIKPILDQQREPYHEMEEMLACLQRVTEQEAVIQ